MNQPSGKQCCVVKDASDASEIPSQMVLEPDASPKQRKMNKSNTWETLAHDFVIKLFLLTHYYHLE